MNGEETTAATPVEAVSGSEEAVSTAAEAPARPRFEDLPPAAQRALLEAEERRRARDAEAAATPRPKEIRGRDGPEPVRYGDWELKGIASDF
ncbi:MAG: DUF1674 domain-containing protein [Siculibacillus sp.]